MSADKWTFTSSYAVMPRENVDTDQIIPARFLTTTSRDGLGPLAFHDWRYDDGGEPVRDFALNRPESAGASILVAGDNFGCGSSREHAVWALMGCGFRAIVSSSFADIFRANALGNGLLPIVVDPVVLRRLLAPGAARGPLAVSLDARTLTVPWGDTLAFDIPPFSRYSLLHGVDEMSFLLSAASDIAAFEQRNPPVIDTRQPWSLA
ncbi:MAG: 3-isopropylmalate dehydratase small subunit [Thermoanaerobaculia bacterium]